MSYGLTVNLLQEVLPLGKTINAATARNNAEAVGQRIDQELGEERVFFIDDWFHITQRVIVMRQMAKGLGVKGSELRELAMKELERIKWFLWYGNAFRALQTVQGLLMDLDTDESAEKAEK